MSSLRLPLPRRFPVPKLPVLPSSRPSPIMPNPVTVAKLPLGAFGPVPDDATTKPHHEKTKSGKFVKFQNIHASFGGAHDMMSMPKVGLKMFWGQLSGRIKFPDVSPPTVDVLPPSFLPDRFASEELRTTWLGHASHYIEYPSGLRVLLDPVLEERCSPFSFLGPKRFTKQPCAIADLPFLDAVIISHSHYDHLSYPTVLEIHRRFPNAHFFVGMGLKKWFKSCGIQNVTELDWWEDAELTVNLADDVTGGSGKRDSGHETDIKSRDSITAKITCLPAQHLSSRLGWDMNKTLWASWAIKSGGGAAEERSVWFGGDTGYRAVPEMPDDEDDYSDKWAHLPRNPQFKQIGELRGPFDLGLIPIGAYAPRWAFSRMHANPFDAVEMFADTRCRQALGIHWGTWTLTTEPVLEPPAKLRDALRRKGVAEEGVFDVCDIGESRHF